jgi:hypothetical protein
MGASFQSIVDQITDPGTLWAILWAGLIALTVGLLILTRTRWGNARPLAKCVIFSVLAHALLIGYAYMTNLFFDEPPGGGADTDVVRVSLSDFSDDDVEQLDPEKRDRTEPWRQLAMTPPKMPVSDDLAPRELDVPVVPALAAPKAPSLSDQIPGLVNDKADSATAPPIGAESSSRHAIVARPEATPITIPRETVSAAVVREPHPAPPPLPRARTDSNRVDSTSTNNGDPVVPLMDDLEARVQRLADKGPQAEFADNQRTELQEPSRTAMADVGWQRVNPYARSATPAAGASSQFVSRPQDTGWQGAEMPEPRLPSGRAVSDVYRLRFVENRAAAAKRSGGDELTEAAVRTALKWLAENQSPDGRWDASSHGAGREASVHGHHRSGAGARADTAVTGLTILTFLAAGNTHLKGEYRENVQHGLEFLLRQQGRDGNLAGDAQLFARMYCHGMATLALGEAYAMTEDQRIKPYLQRAIAYTVAAQKPDDGGWRYQPGDIGSGDMSQFGWQLMAIKSAEAGGIQIPTRTSAGLNTFLARSSTGRKGGLSGYRPTEAPSRTMTAEALVCRFFLGITRDSPAVDEATDFIMQELPGAGRTNLYYWYYASLALHQVHDERWKKWNSALKRELLRLQRKDGPVAGSWDATTVWGSHGGRVYSTAMATLCLEVYYRYLPLQASVRPVDSDR